MTDSILNTIKKLIGIPVSDTAFDSDILVYINDAVSKLQQLGVGPQEPILIVDNSTEWALLTEDLIIQGMAKTFIYLNVRVVFDPPGTSFILEAFNKTILELSWRIEIQANPYVPPVIPV